MLVEFSFAEGETERLRMYTRGGRAAVIELSWSRLLEGMLQEREQSQKSEETYFTLLILSIVLNEGHSRPRAHLCIFCVCACCVVDNVMGDGNYVCFYVNVWGKAFCARGRRRELQHHVYNVNLLLLPHKFPCCRISH